MASISAITTTNFSWGEIANLSEISNDGVVSIQTSGTNVGDQVKITLQKNDDGTFSDVTNGNDESVVYSGAVDENGGLQLTVPQDDWALMDDTTATKEYRFLANWVTPQDGYSSDDVVSAVFTIDRIVPEVTITALSWISDGDTELSTDEMFDDQTVTVTTTNAQDGQNVDVYFRDFPDTTYSALVTSNQAIVTIPSASLRELHGTGNDSIKAIVTRISGNPSQVVSTTAFTIANEADMDDIEIVDYSWGSVINLADMATDGQIELRHVNYSASTTTITFQFLDTASNSYTELLGTGPGEDGDHNRIVLSDADLGDDDSTTVTIPQAKWSIFAQDYTYRFTVTSSIDTISKTSPTFTVDTTTPVINAVETTALSWGDNLSLADLDGAREISITTVDVEDDQVLSFVLNSVTYTGNVNGNSVTITIPRDNLAGLTSGQSYTATVSVSRQSGNPAIDVTTSSFVVDLANPTVNNVAFYWGDSLNNAEIASGGNITITTVSVEDDQQVTLKLLKGVNQVGNDFTGIVSENTTTIPIAANFWSALENGDDYTVTVDVSKANGNQADTFTSDQFSVVRTTPSFTITPGTNFYLNNWVINNSGRTSDDGVNVDFTTDSTNFTITGTLGNTVLTSQDFNENGTFNIVTNQIGDTNATVTMTLTLTDNVSGNQTTETQDIELKVQLPTVTDFTLGWGNVLDFAASPTDQQITFTAAGADEYYFKMKINNEGEPWNTALINVSGTPNDGSETQATIPADRFENLTDTLQYAIKVVVKDDYNNSAEAISAPFTFSNPPASTFTISTGDNFYNSEWIINTAGRVSGVNVDFTTNSTDCTISGTLGGVNLTEQSFTTSGSFNIESGKINNTNGTVLLTLTLTDNTSGKTTVVTQNIEFHVNTLSATITKPDWLSDDRLNADEADTDLALTFNASNATSYIVLVNADGNGYSEIEIGGNITDNSTTIQIPAGTFNSDGTDRGIRVTVSDEFANPSSTAELIFIVDTTPPEFDVGFSSSTFPTHEGEWTIDSQTDSASQNVVTGNVSGAVGDVTLELTRDTDNQVMFTLSQPIGDTQPTQVTFTISAATLQGLANGAYTLTITSTDDAGNSEHDTKALIVNREITVENPIVGVAIGQAAVTGGDPYVTTLSGITYKLDNISGVCRMLQGSLNGKTILINAEMKKDTMDSEEKMNRWCNTIGTFHASHQRGALHNQSFYTRFLVKYGEETAIIDLEKGQMSLPCEGTMKLSLSNTNESDGNLIMYSKDRPYASYDLKINGLILRVKLFSNKQLRNQLAVLGAENIENADGYLIRPMSTKQCRVKKLGTAKFLKMATRTFKSSVTEHFYTGSSVSHPVKKSLKIPRV